MTWRADEDFQFSFTHQQTTIILMKTWTNILFSNEHDGFLKWYIYSILYEKKNDRGSEENKRDIIASHMNQEIK